MNFLALIGPARSPLPARVHRRMTVAIWLSGLSAFSVAQPLAFDEALALALREAPALRANAAQVDAARHLTTPAGELPDPKLALGVDNLPIEGSDRFKFNRDFMTMRRIGLAQEFPNAAKRQARVQRAQARIGLAQAEARLTRLSVLSETAQAWIARSTAEAQLAHIDALRAENRLLDEAVRAQLASGRGLAADVVAPRREAAEIDARRDALLSRRERAIAQLRRSIGAAAEQALTGEAPQWPIERDALRQGLLRHPALEAFESRRHSLDAEVAEASAARRPDWALELAYQKRAPQFGDMVSAQVRFDLPLWSGSRQTPTIAARQSERLALEGEREAVLRERQAELDAELAELRRLDLALERQQRVLQPLADEKVELALATWRGGRGLLADVIAARRERIDTRLETIALAGQRWLTAARLHFAYGEVAGDAAGARP